MNGPENIPKGNNMGKRPDESLLDYAKRLALKNAPKSQVEPVPPSVVQARSSAAALRGPLRPSFRSEKDKSTGPDEKPEVVPVKNPDGTVTFVQKDLF